MPPLKTFTNKKGNFQNFSIVRTPEQNDVVESRNTNLIDVGSTMLVEANLLIQF